MKIKFNNGREYDVFSVIHQMDENDVPIDIVIYGTKENLEQIAEYASVGVNIQECDWAATLEAGVYKHYADNVHRALYARLQSFCIKFAEKIKYTEF